MDLQEIKLRHQRFIKHEKGRVDAFISKQTTAELIYLLGFESGVKSENSDEVLIQIVIALEKKGAELKGTEKEAKKKEEKGKIVDAIDYK